MDSPNHLKNKYELLVRETETLKTKKIIFLERLNNKKINCELKKSKLDSLRNNFMREQRECLEIQNRTTLIKEKNRTLQEKIQLLDDIRINLSEELEKFNPSKALNITFEEPFDQF